MCLQLNITSECAIKRGYVVYTKPLFSCTFYLSLAHSFDAFRPEEILVYKEISKLYVYFDGTSMMSQGGAHRRAHTEP